MPPVPLLRTLRDIRVGQGMRLTELSRLTGLNRGLLSMIERGRMVATPRELQVLSEALGVDVLENRTVPCMEAQVK